MTRVRVLSLADAVGAPAGGRTAGAAVAAAWNATFGGRLMLGPRAYEAWWASPDAEPALAWGVRADDGRLLGALLARAPLRAWAPADLGHVALLVVAPDARGRGIGAALWAAAMAALRARGRTRVRLGADPERLLPGVPLAASAATWRFLAARGVRPGDLEADLRLDLRAAAIDRLPLPPGVQLVDDAPDDALAFVERAFPGRWRDEVGRAAAAGVTVLGLRRDGATIGFCLAQRPTDAALGPALGWTAAAPGGLPDPRVGGLGPLGLAAEARGGGLGLALVAAAARWLRTQGLRAAVIDWTSLTSFYGRLGAHVWRVYQRAEGEP